MKNPFVLAAFALAAACASNSNNADVNATTEPARGSTIVPGSQEDLEQTAGHRVYFAYDQHVLTAQAQETLRRQAQWLTANPGVRIQLAGNCDERGTREYNLALGARRAQSAYDYLRAQGVDPARMSTVSNGKERPIAMGHDESAWSQNRNSTTMVMAASS